MLKKTAVTGVVGTGIAASSGTAAAASQCFGFMVVGRNEYRGDGVTEIDYRFGTDQKGCNMSGGARYSGSVDVGTGVIHYSNPSEDYSSSTEEYERISIDGGIAEFKYWGSDDTSCQNMLLPSTCHSRSYELTVSGEGDYLVLGTDLEAHPVDAARLEDTTPILHADGRRTAKISFVQTDDQVIENVEVTDRGTTREMSGLIGKASGTDTWEIGTSTSPSIIVLGGDLTLEISEWEGDSNFDNSSGGSWWPF